MAAETPDAVLSLFKNAWTAHDSNQSNDDTTVVTSKPAANKPTQVNKDALKLSAEYLRLFTVEAVKRSVMEAKKELALFSVDDAQVSVDPQHLERVLVQLLLDFA